MAPSALENNARERGAAAPAREHVVALTVGAPKVRQAASTPPRTHLFEIVDALAGDTGSRSIATGWNQQLEAASVISHRPDRATRVGEAHDEPSVVDASHSRAGAGDPRPGKEGRGRDSDPLQLFRRPLAQRMVPVARRSADSPTLRESGARSCQPAFCRLRPGYA
jgi:hypothetical protein